MSILNYIEKIKRENESPRITAQEPRIGLSGGLSADYPLSDLSKRMKEAGRAWKAYKGSRQSPKLSYSKFFKLWAAENMAEGGRIGLQGGQLVEPRQGFYEKGFVKQKPTAQHLEIAKNYYKKPFHKLTNAEQLRIKGGKTTGQGFRSIKKVASIEDSALVEKAEKILKKNIKNKNGYKVFKIEKGVMRDKVKPGGLIDQLMKIGLKDQYKITKLIDEIAEKNNWLTKDVYRRNVIVDSYMKDYGEFDEFTGRGKYDSRLVEFKIKTPENEYKWINNTFTEWRDGKFEVEGYDRKKFDKALKKNLKNWKPINVSKKMIATQEELKWLDQMNTKHPNWSVEKVEKAFNKNFKNSEFFMDTSFNNRALDLYPHKMVGNNKGNTLKGVGEGERSKWLKQIVRDTKGGNYTKFLIAADMYEGRGNLKVAQKLKKGAELFFGKKGIFTEMGGQAEHPWFRNYGGWQGQFQIDSLVKGDLNAWKANNFEFPIRDLIKKYEAKGTSDLQKSRIKSQIDLRRKFINHFTDIGDGGMARNITFDFESKPGKVNVINKTPDISKLHHAGTLDPLDMQIRGGEYRKALIKNLGAKDINLLTKDKTISAKRIGAEKISTILSGWCSKGAQRVQEGGRIGFGGCPDSEKITNMKNAAAQLKQHDRYLRGLAETTPFADNAAARELAKRVAASGTKLAKLGRLAFGPMTLWGEPLFEAAFVAHDILGTGIPWKEAVAKSLWAKPAISMGLLKPADQQYEEALYQVQDEEGKALMMDPYHERVRTPIKRFMDNNNKIDKLNKLEKLIHTAHVAGRGPHMYQTPEAGAARVEAAKEKYTNYLESLGGDEGVTKIKAQIENDREAYDTRVAALEIERKGITEEDIFTPSGLKRAGVERAADIKQKQAEEDLMYQQYGKERVESAGIKGTPGEFKKEWIIDPEILESEKEVWSETKTELDKMLKQFGDEHGYGWTPYGHGYGMEQRYTQPGIGDMKYNEELGYRQLLNRVYQSQADGGRAGYTNGGLTRTVAPDSGPMSQGLRSLYIDDMDY